MQIFVLPLGVGHLLEIYCSTTHEENFQHSKSSAKRFAEIHSDWPKLLFGSHALVSGHKNLKCDLPNTPKVCQ